MNNIWGVKKKNPEKVEYIKKKIKEKLNGFFVTNTFLIKSNKMKFKKKKGAGAKSHYLVPV